MAVHRRGSRLLVQLGECYDHAGEDQLLGLLSESADSSQSVVAGQYAALLVDLAADRCVLVADPGGIRSLFFFISENELIVASSLVLIRQLIAERELRDRCSEAYLLRYGYLPPGSTVFSGVRELTPGSIGEVLNSSLVIKPVSVRLATDFPQVASGNYQEALNSLDNVFSEVIQQQLGSSRRVAVLLGGLDSALVASLLVRAGAKVETFSFFYRDERYNQPHVEDVKAFLGIEHHWVEVNEETLNQGLSRFSDTCPFPTMWPGYVLQTQQLIGKIKERGFERCFSGDGCDTLFMGYPSTHRRGQYYKKFPSLNPAASDLILRILEAVRADSFLGHPLRVMQGLIRSSEVASKHRAFRSFQVFDPLSFPRYLGYSYDYWEEHEAILRSVEATKARGSYEKQVYLAKSLISPNRCKLWSSQDLLQGLICSPYLHPLLKEFAGGLSDQMLRPSSQDYPDGKKILLDYALKYDLLPSSVVFQKKLAAISSPYDLWIGGKARPTIQAAIVELCPDLSNRSLNALFQNLAVEAIYRRFFSSDQVLKLAVSLLGTYAMFHAEQT